MRKDGPKPGKTSCLTGGLNCVDSASLNKEDWDRSQQSPVAAGAAAHEAKRPLPIQLPLRKNNQRNKACTVESFWLADSSAGRLLIEGQQRYPHR
jgi:hypothetical protein